MDNRDNFGDEIKSIMEEESDKPQNNIFLIYLVC